jgi:predicted MFS family arabinose efflux permease
MIAVAAFSAGAAIGSGLADVVGVRWVFVISAVAVGIAFLLTIPSVLRLERASSVPTDEQ